MRLDSSTMKKLIFLIAFAIALAWLFFHMDSTTNFLWFIFGLIYPFLLGFIFAFLFNIPMQKVERLLFRDKHPCGRRTVSFTLTLVLLLGLLALLVFLVVPQLVATVALLADQMPGYMEQIQKWLAPYEAYIPQISNWITQANVDWKSLASNLLTGLSGSGGDLLDSAFGFASSIFSGIVNFSIAVIFACYLLLGKELLTGQLKAVLQAYLPQKRYDALHGFGLRAGTVFSSFVGGQCTEALIVGLLFTAVLWVGRFEYALLIGVLAGVMSLVPIFGGYIAVGVGALLTLVAMGGVRALVFIGIFLVLQQIDGSFIYPKVVGSHVGLSAVWVMVAVTVGGSLFGIVGILFFIPLGSIFYALLAQDTAKRLAAKGIAYHSPAKKKPNKKRKLIHRK